MAVQKPDNAPPAPLCLPFDTLMLAPLPRDRSLRLVCVTRGVFQLLDVDTIRTDSADQINHDLFSTVPRFRAEVAERILVDIDCHRQMAPLKYPLQDMATLLVAS
jgi:hypothetical protein